MSPRKKKTNKPETEESQAPAADADAPPSEESLSESQPPADESADASADADTSEGEHPSEGVSKGGFSVLFPLLGLEDPSEEEFVDAVRRIHALATAGQAQAEGEKSDEEIQPGETKRLSWVGYKVSTPRQAGFWRIGRKFTGKPSPVFFKDITDAQREQLEKTPSSVLHVEKLFA